MRDAGVDLARLLASPHAIRPQVASYLGGELLADDIPVVEATLAVDGGSQVPERLTLTVPARHAGTSWVPAATGDPLSHHGQRLAVAYVLPRRTGDVALPLGWFVVQSWQLDNDTVTVEAMGLLQVAADSRLLAPTSPAAGATLGSEFRRLLPPRLPYLITDLTDRAAPRSLAWDEDRLGALHEIADAWPAQLRVDSDGVLRLRPELPATPGAPVLTWADGEQGTVVEAPVGGTRDQVYNAVVVRSENTDDPDRPPVQATAYDADPASPTYWFGPYGQVPRFASSPLVTTAAQCHAMATKLLRQSLRPSRTRIVRAVPDPRVELDDVVQVSFDGQTVLGWVAGIDLPLTAGQGQAAYTIDTP